ncbi:hypothetical protein [Litorihabitans aurantiacus]|uniref:Uncharacterized protein n=1 Tax=Litorihabitans aurantiacus TaxID=1930061 RepID=A0AA37XDY6_9MICO|nr:hypothetical protein [Litorihabitans aurantiacus]GMA31414.1 hypothetical protein GCM10025875_14060 [Litorihabitans aurantiacus]
MPQTVIVLTEDALLPVDVEQILGLAAPDTDLVYSVLVPTEAEHGVVTAFLNNLWLLDLKEAWEDLTGGREDERAARTDATQALGASVGVLEAAGAVVSSATVADDPIEAMKAELTAGEVVQVVAVTQPRPVEDTFHTSWADKAQETLGVPVLHFYSGTSTLGT